jgi:hypothetical protein
MQSNSSHLCKVYFNIILPSTHVSHMFSLLQYAASLHNNNNNNNCSSIFVPYNAQDIKHVRKIIVYFMWLLIEWIHNVFVINLHVSYKGSVLLYINCEIFYKYVTHRQENFMMWLCSLKCELLCSQIRLVVCLTQSSLSCVMWRRGSINVRLTVELKDGVGCSPSSANSTKCSTSFTATFLRAYTMHEIGLFTQFVWKNC